MADKRTIRELIKPSRDWTRLSAPNVLHIVVIGYDKHIDIDAKHWGWIRWPDKVPSKPQWIEYEVVEPCGRRQ